MSVMFISGLDKFSITWWCWWPEDRTVVNMLCFSDPGSVGAGGVQRLLPHPDRPRTEGAGREDQTG